MNRAGVDREEFAAFYAATVARLKAYARCHVSEPSLVDDLTQAAYVRLLTSPKAALPYPERTLYLFRIVTNLARDHWARDKRYETRSEFHEEFVAPPVSQNTERSLDVRRALDKLAPRYRRILWLAYAEDWRHEEIAQVLNVNRLSVKVMLYRGRKMLARLLEKQR